MLPPLCDRSCSASIATSSRGRSESWETREWQMMICTGVPLSHPVPLLLLPNPAATTAECCLVQALLQPRSISAWTCEFHPEHLSFPGDGAIAATPPSEPTHR